MNAGVVRGFYFKVERWNSSDRFNPGENICPACGSNSSRFGEMSCRTSTEYLVLCETALNVLYYLHGPFIALD